jgi:hypothetical protein
VPLVSLRAYARHRGVSLKAVQKAVQSGRIDKSAGGQIDLEAADKSWATRTAPRPAMNGSVHVMPAQTNGPAQREVKSRLTEVNDSRIEVPQAELTPSSGLDYARARAVREGYLARLAKIEFEERSGKLVSRDEVQVAAFNKYRTFREGMLNIPDRLAAVLAAEGDPAKVHDLLSAEIRRALHDVADANS